MTKDNTPLMTHRGAEIRLEWLGLVALALDRPDGIEVGQFASDYPVTRAEAKRMRRAEETGKIRKALTAAKSLRD